MIDSLISLIMLSISLTATVDLMLTTYKFTNNYIERCTTFNIEAENYDTKTEYIFSE